MSNKTPVTVLTGFLGSGKTTLLNRILSEDHGLRIAVIENEFGEIGIDQDLVINANEEVLAMNNGCICCNVRGDLIRILGELAEREEQFDRVIIETTGMADPGPVAQTFFVDKAIKEQYALDGIITLVDAKHVNQHLDKNTDEVMAQIAFADRIILNKADLVEEAELVSLRKRIKALNPMAGFYAATMADAPIPELLDIGGFDLERAVATKSNFLEPEYPFEWAGVWQLPAGSYTLELHNGPDPDMAVLKSDLEAASADALLTLAERVFPAFSDASTALQSGEVFGVADHCYRLQLNGNTGYSFKLEVAEDTKVGLVSQHTPEEFEMTLVNGAGDVLTPVAQHYFDAGHEHNTRVSAVSVTLPGQVDIAKITAWLDAFLMIKGEDLYRMKGVLAVAGMAERVLFQGVHMMFDNQPGEPWGDEVPSTRMVFIGVDLDEGFIQRSLADCLVES